MSQRTKVILLKSIPNGLPVLGDFETVERDVPAVHDGEVLLSVTYLSVDPYLVGKLRGTSTYTAAFKVGEPINSRGVAVVVESKSSNFTSGDVVTGFFDWLRLAVVNEKAIKKAPINDPAVILGVGGSTGLTAYFGLFDVAGPKEGETVLVSGAAGATGSVVGQLAKIKGCRVVGIAGSDEKCNLLTGELGFDAAINYKKTENIQEAIKQACPQGVDVYFDNVGGTTLDAALRNMNNFGRVAICGAISQYGATTQVTGPRNEGLILQKRLRVQGFLVVDYAPRYAEATQKLLEWYGEGKLKNKVTIFHGLEKLPESLLSLLGGENVGKAIVKLD